MQEAEALSISIRGVRKTYGKVRALDSVDLDVKAGEFLTLLGPSGSGKTTLLMIIAGFIRPDCGSLRFGGREMILTPPHRRGIGMVFQSYALFPHMSVASNVAYPLKLRGVGKEEINRRVEEALELVQLSGLGNRRSNELSGGQKQRVALARAIVFAPRILLMDEPLSALDKKLREQMQLELRQLHDTLGMTTVYVTHDQREALTMSDRIAVINNGALMQLDTPQRIYDRPAGAFTADFIGESILLPAQVRNGAVYGGGIAVSADGEPPPDGEYYLLLRPEQLRLLDEESKDGYNVFAGTAQKSVYQGESVLLYVNLAGGEQLRVRHNGEAGVAEGDKVYLGLRRERVVLVARDGE